MLHFTIKTLPEYYCVYYYRHQYIRKIVHIQINQKKLMHCQRKNDGATNDGFNWKPDLHILELIESPQASRSMQVKTKKE